MPAVHLHLMVRAEIVNPPTDPRPVREFMSGLVRHIRMRELAPARAIWCNEPGNKGVTADVLLTTSNAIIHIWNLEDNGGLLEFDLYSCAPYTPDEVVEYIHDNFDVTKLVYKFIDRENGLEVLAQ